MRAPRSSAAGGLVIRSVRRYRRLDIEYAALKVVGRGLFLAVMLMVVFLLVFARVTDQIAGVNEVLIPTVTVDPSIDLGALVRGSFTRTSASVVSLAGMVTLVVSAALTASALRAGTHRALGSTRPTPHLRQWATVRVSIGVPLLVLTCWLLTLATSIRRTAWSSLLGTELNDLLVDLAKAGAVALQWALITAAAALAVRMTSDRWPRGSSLLALAAFGILVTAANYFLLFTYVGSLINPAVSAGIVLVLTVLLWVNVVARAYLGVMCSIAELDQRGSTGKPNADASNA